MFSNRTKASVAILATLALRPVPVRPRTRAEPHHHRPRREVPPT